MNKKLPDVYVYNPTEEEVKELLERMVENGAEVWDDISSGYYYDTYNCWGYRSGYGIYTSDQEKWQTIGARCVTMGEFRKLFPLKDETPVLNMQGKSVSNSKKQQDATIEALKELTAAYRHLGGLECAYDKELLVAEAIIKKVEDE